MYTWLQYLLRKDAFHKRASFWSNIFIHYIEFNNRISSNPFWEAPPYKDGSRDLVHFRWSPWINITIALSGWLWVIQSKSMPLDYIIFFCLELGGECVTPFSDRSYNRRFPDKKLAENINGHNGAAVNLFLAKCIEDISQYLSSHEYSLSEHQFWAEGSGRKVSRKIWTPLCCDDRFMSNCFWIDSPCCDQDFITHNFMPWLVQEIL